MGWLKKLFRKWDAGPQADIGVGRECEAYLQGRYLDLADAAHRAVPAWAWINRLAHGSLDDVARTASIKSREDEPEAFVARLARQTLVKVTHHGVPLETVQKDLLIPLELALAAAPRPTVPMDAAALARVVNQRIGAGLRPIDARGSGRRS